MNSARRVAIAFAASALLSSTISAEPAAQSDFYFSPMLTYTAGDAYDLSGTLAGPFGEEGFGGDFFAGWRKGKRFNLEIGGTYRHLNVNDAVGEDIDQYGVEFASLLFFTRSPRFSPYVLFGAGALELDDPATKNFTLYGSTGLGFLTRLGDSQQAASLRFDVRYFAELESEFSQNDATARLGLNIPVGAPLTTSVALATQEDSDRDGVPDERDRCPATPAGAVVDAQGCELDSDNDGVVDRLDRCPDTPPGVVVNSRGCEPDSDQDGVPNGNDQCPNTPAGAQVDVNGCEIKDVISLPEVEFETNSDRLTPSSMDILNDAAATLLKNPSIVVEVAGYTDSTGEAAYNLDLSQRRAETVMRYLIARGVNPSRMTARGYGENNPIADNTTSEGRAENRRVELVIRAR